MYIQTCLATIPSGLHIVWYLVHVDISKKLPSNMYINLKM